MKKQILFCLALSQSLSIVAGTMQESFLKGNAAYSAGDIDGALKLYQSIDPKGPAVWYNLGNCYYRLSNYPQAIVNWSRARHDASWHDSKVLDIYIAQSYEALGVAPNLSFVTRLHAWITDVTSLCSLLMLQLLFLFCFFLSLFIFPRLVKRSRYYMIVLLSFLTVIVGLLCIIKYRDQEYPCGIVTKNSISVYAGPGLDYARLTEAKMLDKVHVYQRRDDWLKVYFARFGYGWVATGDLAVI